MRTARCVGVAALLGVLAGIAAAQPARDGVPEAVVRFDGQKVVSVRVNTNREFLAVTSLAESVWTHSPGIGGDIDVQVTAEQFAALQQLGLPMTVKIENLQAKIDAERAEIEARRLRRDLSWFGNYKTLTEFNAKLTSLAASDPQKAQTFFVGNTLEGRAVSGIAVSGPDLPGNPRALRPQLVFNGCQHAREWISPMTVMFIADQLMERYATDARVRDIMNAAEFLLVPVVNADGYEYTWSTNRLWRKNRRNNGNGTFGVDPNRNWGYQWGGEGASTSGSAEDYRGTGPFSEPETQIMRDFVLAHTRLRASIDFHSYSQLILSPWSYTSTLPPDAAIFDQLNADMRNAILATFGVSYTAGPTYTTIYPASGSSGDWCYGAGSTPRKILAWGWELRDTGANGFILPPDQIIPTGEENFAAVLTLAESIAFPAKFTFPDGLPAYATDGATTQVRVNVVASPGSTLQAGSAKVYTRLPGGSFAPATLTSLGGSLYRADLPVATCGQEIEFYFETQTTTGGIARSPASAPDNVHKTTARQVSTTFADACEVTTGWTVGAAGDNAVRGIWSQGVPQATAAQPGADHSPAGTRAWMTDPVAGSSVGANDVDTGVTTLTSPTFSALPPSGHTVYDTTISYWRWYSNDQGSNPNSNTMPVQISSNNGASWVTLEDVSENAGAWVGKTFSIPAFVTPTATMKLRFIARDLTGAVVEAGVDDLEVKVVSCPCKRADINCDGFIDAIDYDLFISAWLTNDPSADYNGDEFVDAIDYDLFISDFLAG